MSRSEEAVFTFPGEVADGVETTASAWAAVYRDLLSHLDRVLLEEPGSGGGMLSSRRRQFRARLRYWESELRRLRRAREVGDAG